MKQVEGTYNREEPQNRVSLSPVTRRLESIDSLRGLVLILMVLDHIRDFMQPGTASPETIPDVEPALFFTRFVTHFCAPVFFLLAGMSAYFYKRRRGSQLALTRFLITRGLWLILLELTVVHVGWQFSAPLSGIIFLQVIWALGWSMIVLGLLSWLPVAVILTLSVLAIGLHHLIPIPQGFFSFANWGPDWILAFLHGKMAPVSFPSLAPGKSLALVIYPLVPWVAVMGLGFCIAPFLAQDDSRSRRCLYLGIGTCALFVLLRLSQLGLDPNPYAAGWIDFFNTSKYPPSLPFLAMTLGPAFLGLALLETTGSRDTVSGYRSWLLVFGRVPLFFYVTHIFLAHGVATLWIWLKYRIWVRDLIGGLPLDFEPASLPSVYIGWFVVVLILYWPCRWFMRLRQNHPDWRWLSYL